MKILSIALISILTNVVVYSQNALYIPDTISGQSINLNIQNGSKQFYSGAATQTMGINGPILAPTVILNKHQNITFNVKNNLSDTTTIHWHGMHVAPQNDGGPHIIILPGQTWSPSFEVLDNASTMWYHPHLHHKTYDHVQKGIAGFIIVRDSNEAKIVLPRTYGIDDIPLVLQTKGIDSNNQIITEHTALDTALFINGTIKPFFNAPAQVVRLRILNGSPERVYNIGLTGDRTFYQIGSDAGLLSAPVSLTRLLLSPGERAEILVDLSSLNGQVVELMNYGSQIPNAHYGATQPGMGAGQVIPNYSSNPLNGRNFTLLTINVIFPTQNPATTIPTQLITHNPWAENSSNITRSLVFTSMTMGPGGINGPFLINNAHFDMDIINFEVPFNNTEIWELRNQTPIAHPFHIHNVSFYILSINGVAPPANLRGRKDVVLVPGGNSVVRFITKFEDFYNDSLPYMYHCHMLSHEDEGMMGQFVVKTPCDGIVQQPSNTNGQIGEDATFSVKAKDTINTTYQWQSNIGFGFQDIQNAGQYSGTNTATLRVSALAMTNNNQQFRCKVVSPSCQIISDIASLTIGTTGLKGLGSIPELHIYPNPTKNHIVIEGIQHRQQIAVTIYSLLGERVLSFDQLQSNSVNTESLSKGIYFLVIKENGVQVSSYRLIKE